MRHPRRPAARRPDVLSRLARLFSAPLEPWDRPNLRLQDGLNRRVARLWWPVGVPSRNAQMPTAAHGLYVVHAWGIAALVRLPRRRAWGLMTFASWALFTGAWDRRALRS